VGTRNETYMEEGRGNNITEQEVGSPVPVGVVGERAGPARPSASDCSVSMVLSQARDASLATGRVEEEVDPFLRRDSISRTPPRGRTSSTPDIFFKCEDPPSKRKREENISLGKPSKQQDDNIALKKLKDTFLELRALVKSIPNTKGEIKKGIEQMYYIAETLGATGTKNIRQKDKVTETERMTSEIGTQTEPTCPHEIEGQLMEKQAREEIWKLMEGEESYSTMEEIAWRDWPKSAYRKIKFEKGNPVKAALDWDLAFYITDGASTDRGLTKVLKEQYPCLIEAEKPENGNVTCFVTTAKLTVPGRPVETKEKHVFKLTPEKTQNRNECLKSMYCCVRNLREIVLKEDREKIAVTLLDYPDIEIAKKTLEYLFHGTKLEIAIYTSHDETTLKPTVGDRPGKSKRRTSRQGDKEAIVIKAEGRSYADLLREVKNKVDPEKIGVVVRELRKTRKGDMLVTLDKGEEKNKLKQEIEKEMQGVIASDVRRGDKTLHVMDMDAVITEEELLAEMVNQFQVSEKDMLIKNIRPTSSGKQKATIMCNYDVAQKILDVGKVKIGWISCRIKERVTIQRCYRCHGYGHSARDCKGPNRKNACFRCEKEGHRADSCQNEEFCCDCDKEGHRAGTLKCPSYRKILRSKSN
jgi:hypothetical protein